MDLSKQKDLDADPRAIQQIVFPGAAGGKTVHYSWKIKRNCTRILQRNSKSFGNNINGWIQ